MVYSQVKYGNGDHKEPIASPFDLEEKQLVLEIPNPVAIKSLITIQKASL